MSVFITIISGVTVYVLGQIILKLFIEPIQSFRLTVGDIATSLVKYAHVLANPGVLREELMEEASTNFRTLASILCARVDQIPKYQYVSKLFSLPSIEHVYNARTKLIFISNNVLHRGNDIQGISQAELNCRRSEEISDLLGIYVPPDERISRD